MIDLNKLSAVVNEEDFVERMGKMYMWFDGLPTHLKADEKVIDDVSKGMRILVSCRGALALIIGNFTKSKIVLEDRRTEKRKEMADLFYQYAKDKDRIEEIEVKLTNEEMVISEKMGYEKELDMRRRCVGLSWDRCDIRAMNSPEVRKIRREFAEMEGQLKMAERLFTVIGDMLKTLAGDKKRIVERWKLDIDNLLITLKKEGK